MRELHVYPLFVVIKTKNNDCEGLGEVRLISPAITLLNTRSKS